MNTGLVSRLRVPPLLLAVAGLVLGIALIILLFRSVDLGQLGDDFSRVDYRWLAPGILAFAANLLLKVPRWALLYGEDAPSFDILFGAMNVGYAINSLLPLRLGEVVRAYWVRDRAGVSMVRSLSTIALERVADGLTVLVLFFILAPTVAFPAKLRGSALAVGVVFAALLVGMLVLVLAAGGDNRFSRALGVLEEGRWAPLARVLVQVAGGLHVLRNARATALLIAYTAGIWASNALLLWFVLKAFHLEVPFSAGILGNSVVSLGMTVPSTPGYVGVFDYLMVITLGLYGVARTPALAASLVFHAIAFIPVTIIGVIYLARVGWGVTVRMLRTGAEQAV